MDIQYAPKFIRQFNKLDKNLQTEVYEKIEVFKSGKNLESLRIHKLNGKLRNELGFWVNFRIRIRYVKKPNGEYWFLRVGPHNIYD